MGSTGREAEIHPVCDTIAMFQNCRVIPYRVTQEKNSISVIIQAGLLTAYTS